MTELIAFAERHPVWTLAYLVVMAWALHGLVRVRISRKP